MTVGDKTPVASDVLTKLGSSYASERASNIAVYRFISLDRDGAAAVIHCTCRMTDGFEEIGSHVYFPFLVVLSLTVRFRSWARKRIFNGR